MQKENKMIKAAIVFFVLGLISTPHIQAAVADDTPTQTIQKSASDASTNAKKTTRKAKKTARKATGTDTVTKDVKDKANDVGDDVSNTAKKAKIDTQ